AELERVRKDDERAADEVVAALEIAASPLGDARIASRRRQGIAERISVGLIRRPHPRVAQAEKADRHGAEGVATAGELCRHLCGTRANAGADREGRAELLVETARRERHGPSRGNDALPQREYGAALFGEQHE